MKLFIVFLSAAALLAQQPRIVNAKLQTAAVSGSLASNIKTLTAGSTTPQWVAWAEPIIAGRHNMCCSNSNNCCGACSLEQRNSGIAATISGTIKLEGPEWLLVAMRLTEHRIDQLKVFSVDCELDAGGLPFHLLTGVAPADSVNYLASVVPEYKQAVMAIALHRDPSADSALERLSGSGQTDKVREDVAFWLGSTRGRRGLELLKQMLRNESSDRVREKVMFGFSVSSEPEAVAQLIESARTDPSPKVRGQALFWLAHKAGQKETAAINRALNEDPDTHVKKQAVFALQQLPPNEGIPLLIQVARTNKNPEVRKQAIFWLGQSKDERAVKFFEEVLGK